MPLTDAVPQVSLAEMQEQMLDPVIHDHMGRHFGRAKRASIEGLLVEAVELLKPAFAQAPPFWQMTRLLMSGGHSAAEIDRIMQPLRDFWRGTSSR
jgi:hypothetical protein